MANIILEAAESGHLGVYQLVTEKCVNKNPPSLFTTPLHKAAGRGHLSICQFIIKNTEEKNPKMFSALMFSGPTPLDRLHDAARVAEKYGHFEICRLIRSAIPKM